MSRAGAGESRRCGGRRCGEASRLTAHWRNVIASPNPARCRTGAVGRRPRTIDTGVAAVRAAERVTTMTHDGETEEAREKRLFEKSLRAHGQLAERDAEELPPGATHQVEKDDEGRDVIRRKRFSAT